MSSLRDILAGLASGEEMAKQSFVPPAPAGGMPPADPNMAAGAPPMDPAMAAGGAPPPMAPPPPPPMPPQGGMPPMPPQGDPGMGAAPQIDPAQLQQLLQMLMDPNVQEMLAQVGIIVDPQRGPVEQATGRVLEPEEIMQVLEEMFQMMMAQQQGGMMPPGMPPQQGMPPQGGMMPPKMAYEMMGAAPAAMQGGATPGMMQGQPDPYMEPAVPAGIPPELEDRLSALEELVGQIAAKMGVENPGTPVEEGFTPEAQAVIEGEEPAPAEVPKVAEEQKAPETEKLEGEIEKEAGQKEDKSRGYVPSAPRKEDAASKLSRVIGRLRSCAD